jgi:hypothetical protein
MEVFRAHDGRLFIADRTRPAGWTVPGLGAYSRAYLTSFRDPDEVQLLG